MSEGAHASADHGHMDIHEQKGTFDGFLLTALWGTLLIVMSVGLLTVAFAMNLGWFAGLATFVVLGVLAGLGLNMGGAWWAMLIGVAVLGGIGGGIVSLLM